MKIVENIEEEVCLIEDKVCGIGPWLWAREKSVYLDTNGTYVSDGGLWGGPKNDFEISHQFAVFKACKHFDVVVQAGGACGMYPRLLATKFKYVYTFEPHYLNFRCLVYNCPSIDIYKIQAALGNENKMVGLVCCDRNYGEGKIIEGKGEIQGTIPMFKIDQLGLWKCDLIWLDIEGSERGALEGAVETIKKFRPTVVVENGHMYGIPDFMESLNYTHSDTSSADYIYVPNEQIL